MGADFYEDLYLRVEYVNEKGEENIKITDCVEHLVI